MLALPLGVLSSDVHATYDVLAKAAAAVVLFGAIAAAHAAVQEPDLITGGAS